MERKSPRVALSSIIVFFALVFFSANCHAVEMLCAFEAEAQPPYYMGNTVEVLYNPGVAVEMMKALEELIPELTVKFERMPWKRCKRMLEKNLADGLFNASYKPRRLKIGWYPTLDNTHKGALDIERRITNISYNFYKHKNSPVEFDGKKLINLQLGKVGADRGYSIVDDLNIMGYKNIVLSSTHNENLKKLNRGWLDVIAFQDITGDALIRLPENKNIVKIQPPINTKPYFLMLSKKFVTANPKLAIRIWDSIKIIRETRHDKLVEKYAVD